MSSATNAAVPVHGAGLDAFPVQRPLVAADVAGRGRAALALVSVAATALFAARSWFLGTTPRSARRPALVRSPCGLAGVRCLASCRPRGIRVVCRASMPDMPAVTVIIPAYNGGRRLENAVSSVVSQTLGDLELIVVDDGGSEDLSWVARRDPRIRLISQRNFGVSVARNVGVHAARSDYVAFLDQDDEWLPSKLESQMHLISVEADAAFYYTDFFWTRGEATTRAERQAISYRGLLADQHVCLSSMMVSKRCYAAVGGHDPLLVQMQDYDLFLRLAMSFGDPVGVAEPLVRYHLHDDNVSRDYFTAYRERVDLIRQHRRRAIRSAAPDVVRACDAGLRRSRTLYGSQAFDGARQAVREGDPAALRHLARASRLHPAYTVKSLATWLRNRIAGAAAGSGTS